MFFKSYGTICTYLQRSFDCKLEANSFTRPFMDFSQKKRKPLRSTNILPAPIQNTKKYFASLNKRQKFFRMDRWWANTPKNIFRRIFCLVMQKVQIFDLFMCPSREIMRLRGDTGVPCALLFVLKPINVLEGVVKCFHSVCLYLHEYIDVNACRQYGIIKAGANFCN